MSKPETPCLPGCREEATYPSNGIGWRNSDGVRKIHVTACPNAPKAEAPPAPKRVNHKWRYESTDGVKDSVVSTCMVCGLRLDGWPGPHRNPGCKPAPPAPVNEPYEAAFNVLEPALGLSCEDPACDLARDHKPPHRLRKSAPVSEPPRCKRVIYPDGPTCAEDIRALLDQINSLKLDRSEVIRDNTALKAQNATLTERVMELYRSAVARRDAAEAKVAALTVEVEWLKENVGVKYGATGMCQDRHPMVMFPSAGGWGENCPMCAIRAAREAGKA